MNEERWFKAMIDRKLLLLLLLLLFSSKLTGRQKKWALKRFCGFGQEEGKQSEKRVIKLNY
jgi:hypothetical protein